jgi:hypothetical protein
MPYIIEYLEWYKVDNLNNHHMWVGMLIDNGMMMEDMPMTLL